ncbi:tetratricopeptide repeat-containing sulfotransferase family protein [uncultured Microbulbifer sp.]|uniref:tetratricopeptide repeat-containing sulfotransferase family protein n=1 Tax=uncultured Microbulbifer sp. TaxID=348147 RepID=UPI0026344245|nr:tetratricopeptide repeat-containing sulfotransferase family protein [uncultured Microbulbifer sp.]
MKDSLFFHKRIQEVRKLVRQHQFSIAEESLLGLLSASSVPDDAKVAVLKELYQINLKVGKKYKAIGYLESLALELGEESACWLELFKLAESLGDTSKAVKALRKYVEREPNCSPDIYFNLAFFLKSLGRFEESLGMYMAALSRGISDPEEVYTNIGVIHAGLRREDRAIENYRKALELNKEYIPALLNLAGLSEESGGKEEAVSLYQEVLSINNENSLALSRMAHLYVADTEADFRIKGISELLNKSSLADKEREELMFALGKLYDDCQLYDEAFSCVTQANEIGRKRVDRYVYGQQEKLVDSLIDVFSEDWFSGHHSKSSATPVFICGMFRSGSTLLEQILCGHGSILASGERDFIPRQVESMGVGYPHSVLSKGVDYFDGFSKEYLSEFEEGSCIERLITDKRPDNFLHVGLIKTVFPEAKVIWTRRNLLDNCISIYFQQFSEKLDYAIDLEGIAHFYSEHVRLMEYWERIFPCDIYRLQYEDLVLDPKIVIGGVLNFLGLPWDSKCLKFSGRSNYVKTASIWQVREPLYLSSVGRSDNYLEYLSPLKLERFLR